MAQLPIRDSAYLALSAGMITVGYFGLNGTLENSLLLTTGLFITLILVSIDLGRQLTQFDSMSR